MIKELHHLGKLKALLISTIFLNQWLCHFNFQNNNSMHLSDSFTDLREYVSLGIKEKYRGQIHSLVLEDIWDWKTGYEKEKEKDKSKQILRIENLNIKCLSTGIKRSILYSYRKQMFLQENKFPGFLI